MDSFKNFSENASLNEAEALEKTRIRNNPEILPSIEGSESSKNPTNTPKRGRKKISRSGYEYGKEGRVTSQDVDVFQTRQRTGGYGEVGATRGGQPGVGQTKTVATITKGPYKGATPISASSRRILQTYAKSSGVGQNPLRSEPGTGSIPTEGQKRLKRQITKKIETKYQITPPEKPKSFIEPSPRTPAARDAFRDFQKDQGRTFSKRVIQAIKDLPAEPTSKTAAPKTAAPKPQSINLGDTSLPKTFKAPKGSSLSVSAPKPTVAMTPDSVGKAFDQVLKNKEARKAAQKAANMTKFVKGVNAAGTALSVVGSGIEAKGGYETARQEGASKKRALGAGAARGLGSFIGGGVGAAAGSVLGLPGAIAGGAAGYSLGANVGTAVYKAVTGDPLKKLTTKGVLTNVRKAVPYEVRKQVPAGARKAFRDFVTQAGKSYGNWQRSQQQQGGNK